MSTVRQRAIQRLIAEQIVTSQAQLVDLLGESGFVVTQATVSRDLQAIGAVRDRDADGHTRYLIPTDLIQEEADSDLAGALEDYAVAISGTGSLIVVRTPPGAAHVVGAAIDASSLEGVLGTVAGDDTVLVIADSEPQRARIVRQLERVGGRP